MKVLFIASKDHETLMIQQEITLLQRRALAAPGEDVTFHFLPNVAVEDLPLELSRHRPDVLHISAHASAKGIEFANSSGHPVLLTADHLLSLLHPEHPPKLIYLNGCTASKLAARLLRRAHLAIGSTAQITNRAAMAAAVVFYDRLITGLSVQQAFDAAQATVRAIGADKVSADLQARSNVDPERLRLYHVPRIIAKFASPPSDKDGDFFFEFGLLGCRHDTVQVVFLTDDESYNLSRGKHLESDLCLVVRDRPTRGMLWSNWNAWYAYGDFVIHACATTSAGRCYSVSSTLCEAIEAKFALIDDLPTDQLLSSVRSSLARLHSEDGSGLSAPPKRASKKTKKKSKSKSKKSRANS